MTMASDLEEKKTKVRKLRPKLQPIISPDRGGRSFSFDDEGLGFGHILTDAAAAAAKDKGGPAADAVAPTPRAAMDEGKRRVTMTPTAASLVNKLDGEICCPSTWETVDEGETPTLVTPREMEDDMMKEGGEIQRQFYKELPQNNHVEVNNVNVEQHVAAKGAASNAGGGGGDDLAKYSSITTPTAVNLQTLCLSMDDSEGEECSIREDAAVVNQACRDVDFLSPIKVSDGSYISMSLDLDAVNGQCGVSEGTQKDKDLSPPATAEDDASVKSSESESSSDSSSSSSSSSDETESESTASDLVNSGEASQLQQLQSEIQSRQKLLTKLLRGKEGTAYADMIQRQEELVNSQLGGRADHSTDNDSKLRMDPFSKLKTMLLDEYYHTLPGAFSLIVHCFLYVTIYAMISKAVSKACDAVIIYLTGWGTGDNWFDCTRHEHAFYAITLILSLIAARVTGAVHDWNENRIYQKRVAFQLRNKWYLKCWDARLVNYFHGDALAEKYENENEEGSGKRQEEESSRKPKRWGSNLKYMLDLFSFFICYKCIDYFVYSLGTAPFTEITQTVLDGLPSRQLQEARDVHLVENGVSYACESVRFALENPYTEDMLNWISTVEFEAEEAKNWITNAKTCGWSGDSPGEGEVEENGEVNDSADADENDAHTDTDGSKNPMFISQKRIMSAHDDAYLQKLISLEAYYELVGDPNPRFFDPAREMLFLMASTATCIGLLYAFGIPFLLI